MLRTAIAGEVKKAAPVLATSGATLLGVTLPDVLLYASILYAILQSAYLVYRWWCHWQDRRP